MKQGVAAPRQHGPAKANDFGLRKHPRNQGDRGHVRRGRSDKADRRAGTLAFARLEGQLTTLKGRRFYGVVVDAQYRACVPIRPEDYADALPHPTWVIPGGKFARRKLAHWEQHL